MSGQRPCASGRGSCVGFLGRVEEHKKAGNAAFGKQDFAGAVAEYDAGLQLLVTVAEDRAIVIGQKKWNQVIVLRALLHLNKSACHCKTGAWREAVADASACLQGNLPTETKLTHPHILSAAKRSSIPDVDPRLSAAVRSKAWFRLSEGYLRLGYFARAKHAAARALGACEDEKLRALVDGHSQKVDALAKRAKRQQLRHFRGYWTKLEQQQGGYVKRDLSKRGQTKSKWEGLGAAERLQHVNALDGSDGDSDSDYEGFADEGRAAGMLSWDGPPELAADRKSVV